MVGVEVAAFVAAALCVAAAGVDAVPAPAPGNAIVVCFSKFGKSELTYDVTSAAKSGPDGPLQARLVNEKIALAHRAFRSDIEGKLKKVLLACGAKVTEG